MHPGQLAFTPKTDRSAGLRPVAGRLAAGGLVALAALVGLAGCGEAPTPTAPTAESGQPVRVATVATDAPPTRLRLPGVTRAFERADLAFLHAGHLAERHVRRGEAVQADQALAVLQNPSLMPGVAAAQARVHELDERLGQLQRETRRLENLHERGLVATEELDAVRSRRNAAQQARVRASAELDEARDQLEEATLTAPFAGRVVDLPVEPGQFVSAGQTVVTLSAPDRLEVVVDLAARQAGGPAPGDEARVRRLDGGQQLTGTLREIGLPAPGRPARAVIDLPDTAAADWLPGQAVHVELAWSSEPALLVPLDALIDTGDGLPHVFRLREGRADLVSVIPGGLDGGRVRVSAQLDAGDEVIVAGHGQLLDGERVRVLP